MKMPTPDQSTIDQRKSLISGFSRIVGSENVISDDTSLRTYDSDGLTAYKQMPMLVVLPGSTKEISEVMRFCGKRKVKFGKLREPREVNSFSDS